jgi:hypothetical protein
MAVLRGRIAFGARIAIKTPLAFDERAVAKVLAQCEGIVSTTLRRALVGAMNLLPFVDVAITDAESSIRLESSDALPSKKPEPRR